MTKKKNIAMAGGGSGGHVFPIQSLLDFLGQHKEFYSSVNTVYWFGTRQSLEHKTFQNCQNSTKFKIKFLSILSGKFRRETKFISWLKNFRDIFLFLIGIFQSIFFLLRYQIDTVFCKGGFVALPVVIAAFILRKKIVLHESDVRAGLTNKVAAKFATKTFTGFPGVFEGAEVVGQILSDDLFSIFAENLIDKKTKNTKLVQDRVDEILSKLKHKKPLILVLGGSLGSKRLYENLHSFMSSEADLAAKFNYIVIGGFLNTDISNIFQDFDFVYTIDFVNQKDMGKLCFHADIGLTRAGTTSLAEQKLFDMKLLIVPIAWTHDQYANAEFYTNTYGDILVDQKNNFQQTLTDNLIQLTNYKKNISTQNQLETVQTTKNKIRTEIMN